uniref:ceramide synthase LOH2 n=1 Tax=Erigeron canadensis TaxID=72917 RepID=UPI001CB9A4D7|nr:ceramide synthase LOH2 [Erigeron canadensis]
MESIWNQNVFPTPARFTYVLYFAFTSFFARFLLDRYIFQKVSIWLLRKRDSPMKINKATKAKIAKITESMWKLTYYATVEFCVLAITYREPWFRDITKCFKGWPNQELKFSLELVYMCQCGFYIYSIAALLLWETRRKDFAVMMSHHIITVFLIGHSYITRFFRIGSLVLAVHDASDVFLEGAKILKYSGKELGASVLFGMFALSWLILRLIIFPFWIIRATSNHLLDALNPSEIYDMTLYYIYNAMLLNLLVFHIYWWILIFNMIMRQLKNRGQLGEDIRSDSEDDD